MGCFQSRKDSGDIHPNVFRVINIDDEGNGLRSGQLEVTDNEIILYREGCDATVWPLKCLRRYGYDNDIFSFESGRRCATGQGIYAFKCRRAGILFSTLQQNIQLRNLAHDASPFQMPETVTLRPLIQPRNNIQTDLANLRRQDLENSNANHITIGASVIISNSPQSPNDILEMTPLNLLSEATHRANIYQIQSNFRENNNNINETDQTSTNRHNYSNDINVDLALLRTSLKHEVALNTLKEIEDETHFLRLRYSSQSLEITTPPISPTQSSTSEHYATLNVEDEKRPYMNIPLNELKTSIDSRSDSSVELEQHRLIVKPVLSTLPEEVNTYANVALGENSSHPAAKINPLHIETGKLLSESDTILSMSSLDDLEMNYAVLDIEADVMERVNIVDKTVLTHSVTVQSSKFSPQSSKDIPGTPVSCSTPPKTPIGYTTIDFDKTVALSSVVSGSDIDTEGSRRTRHNSTALLPASPT